MKRRVGRIPWDSKFHEIVPRYRFFSKLLESHFWSDLYKMTYYNVFLKMIFIIGMNYFYRFIKIFKVFEHFVNDGKYFVL